MNERMNECIERMKRKKRTHERFQTIDGVELYVFTISFDAVLWRLHGCSDNPLKTGNSNSDSMHLTTGLFK